jgi:uncharacterized membrane protein
MWWSTRQDQTAVLADVRERTDVAGIISEPGRRSTEPAGGRADWARAVVLGQIVLATAVVSIAAVLSLAGPPTGTTLTGEGWLWARIPLGLIVLFLLPGYSLGLFLLPRFTDLDTFERAGAAVGLSLAQYPLLALGLDRSPWGLSPAAIIMSVTLLTWLWGIAAAARVSRIGRRELLTASWPAPLALPNLSRLESLTALAGVGLLGAVAWSVWAVISQPALPPLTEFYALGSDGSAQNYPSVAARNVPISVSLAVHNLENEPLEYAVTAQQRLNTVGHIPPFAVAQGETRTATLTIALPDYGFGQRVDILLFRSDGADPYRNLTLVIDVPQDSVPTPVRIASTALPTVVRADATAANPQVPTPVPPARQ